MRWYARSMHVTPLRCRRQLDASQFPYRKPLLTTFLGHGSPVIDRVSSMTRSRASTDTHMLSAHSIPAASPRLHLSTIL
ncbi:hypothetical protein TGRH88_006210 [Toxoplasma gondii]|uniref:Uncharacterized protein n=1 Tax=Toxoplasma gondii TaxID=5811 RepID=A0A7J6KE24_TOXGO|nr:hypothetical protein TGRH88_006180 [Toxoplasma gondii]KAF4645180.1 hypothetical protein TGRH88_006190 [Toxoplasma gondii]KAF4645182.1 hypothetical protein TGRH88_006210 [Toxoplasma gondii]